MQSPLQAPAAATDPKSVNVNLTTGTGVDIEWKDGHRPGALPMFKPSAKPVSAEGIGKYAIRFKWNDGHDLGIYSWQFLREVCPCRECAATRAAG